MAGKSEVEFVSGKRSDKVDVSQVEPPGRPEAIRVNFTLTNELAKQSLEAAPKSWRTKRAEYWVGARTSA